jgi:hypothetical protein
MNPNRKDISGGGIFYIDVSRAKEYGRGMGKGTG